MYQNIGFAITVTGPILILLILGIFFRRGKLIDLGFIATSNKLIFNITLPCLLFLSISGQPVTQTFDTKLIGYASLITVILVVVLRAMSTLFVDYDKRGVFVQGSFRGNMGIIGLALVLYAFGDGIMASAGVYLAFLTILYNLLATWLLIGRLNLSAIRSILSNPLIIGVLTGIGWSLTGIQLPGVIRSAGDLFARMTLPLALLCIGGSLQWQSLKANHGGVLWASSFKLIVFPFLTTLGGVLIGLRGQDLGLLFIMSSCPSAAASFVMAKQMTNHGDMAAEIVAITTASCAITISLGLVILKYFLLI